MWTWENKTVKGDILYSSLIASYRNACDKMHHPFHRSEFEKWLRTLSGISDEEIHEMCDMATVGKILYEVNAYEFIQDLHTEQYNKLLDCAKYILNELKKSVPD